MCDVCYFEVVVVELGQISNDLLFGVINASVNIRLSHIARKREAGD